MSKEGPVISGVLLRASSYGDVEAISASSFQHFLRDCRNHH